MQRRMCDFFPTSREQQKKNPPVKKRLRQQFKRKPKQQRIDARHLSIDPLHTSGGLTVGKPVVRMDFSGNDSSSENDDGLLGPRLNPRVIGVKMEHEEDYDLVLGNYQEAEEHSRIENEGGRKKSKKRAWIPSGLIGVSKVFTMEEYMQRSFHINQEETLSSWKRIAPKGLKKMLHKEPPIIRKPEGPFLIDAVLEATVQWTEGEDKLEQSLSQDLLDMYDEYYTPEEPTAAFDSNDDSVFIVDDDYESSEDEETTPKSSKSARKTKQNSINDEDEEPAPPTPKKNKRVVESDSDESSDGEVSDHESDDEYGLKKKKRQDLKNQSGGKELKAAQPSALISLDSESSDDEIVMRKSKEKYKSNDEKEGNPQEWWKKKPAKKKIQEGEYQGLSALMEQADYELGVEKSDTEEFDLSAWVEGNKWEISSLSSKAMGRWRPEFLEVVKRYPLDGPYTEEFSECEDDRCAACVRNCGQLCSLWVTDGITGRYIQLSPHCLRRVLVARGGMHLPARLLMQMSDDCYNKIQKKKNRKKAPFDVAVEWANNYSQEPEYSGDVVEMLLVSMDFQKLTQY